jgi:hypothetical protein
MSGCGGCARSASRGPLPYGVNWVGPRAWRGSSSASPFCRVPYNDPPQGHLRRVVARSGCESRKCEWQRAWRPQGQAGDAGRSDSPCIPRGRRARPLRTHSAPPAGTATCHRGRLPSSRAPVLDLAQPRRELRTGRVVLAGRAASRRSRAESAVTAAMSAAEKPRGVYGGRQVLSVVRWDLPHWSG